MYFKSVLLANMINCDIYVSFSKTAHGEKGWFCTEVYKIISVHYLFIPVEFSNSDYTVKL
jgi:hypothetical protein